jgi:hypothetical protein
LSYRHHGRGRGGMGWESKPSSVPDGHLSRPQKGPATSSPSWRLSTSGLGEQPASGRFGDCCGEDCPFHPGKPVLVSVALARSPARQSGLSTRGLPRASPAFTGHPCSVQLGLSSGAETPATILAHPMPRLSMCSRSSHPGATLWNVARLLRMLEDPRCRRGDLNSHEVTLTTP